MFSRIRLVLALLLAVPCAAAIQQQERVIAGSPADSLEVRHLVLRGTNEEIGRALAEIARERYDVRPDPSRDAIRQRALRRYIERNDPILFDRMRGVAAAFGHRLDDDAWDHSQLGFTNLRAGCSIVHLPPSATTAGASVVSRDYDFSTGSLSFGFLPPGMLHPTSRPYLVELHPERGYASLAMVAYDLLSGVLDGINSEGLVVTMAMDDELFSSHKIEPTLGPAPGLGVLQTLRLILDTCANVDEAKEALLATKQYYEFVPVHFLIADRFGKSFVWEYGDGHNKEFIIESPGRPLVMTNFTMNKHMSESEPPTAEQARSVCKRYAFLAERLASGPVSEELLRETHRKVDAQAPPAPDAKRPPIRTFWHALYYPEQRRVKYSFFLRDDASGRPVRSEYVEFRLEGGGRPDGGPAVHAAAPAPAGKPAAHLGDATLKKDGDKVVAISFEKAADPMALLPLLRDLPDLRTVQLAGTNVGDEALAQLAGLTRLEQLGLKGTRVTDAGLVHVGRLTNLINLNLSDTQVTDAGLAQLGKLSRLETISLANDAITDAGLAHIAKLTNVAGLVLTGTKVTDAGLEQLKPLGRMTKLNVSKTAVTEAGVAAAKKFLPFWASVQR
ncbi:MAG TPA: C45 family autoproteolytic acyltransferase/hydrolase [Thermoanaerobaculia bacterium]|nr:C45 family autoproteolytic acyltransferase/hydrolase [Thermoanaerobaculia bacterium]